MSQTSLIMYFLVRHDLRMGKGKIAAQCGHAVQDLIMDCPKDVLYDYRRNNSPKICLKVPDLEQLTKIADQCKEQKIPHTLIIDAGKTQIPADTTTVLGIGPVRKYLVFPLVQNLSLL